MASITNNTREAVILPTGHTVARLDRLETTNAVLRSPDNVRTITTMVAAKMIDVEYDPDPIEEAAEAATSVIDAPAPAPVSTYTLMPRRSSSLTPSGVSATRPSDSLISRGTPTVAIGRVMTYLYTRIAVAG